MKNTKLALIYDFDKTLSPRDMQEFHLLSTLGYDDPDAFWKECDAFAKRNNCDGIRIIIIDFIEKLGSNLAYKDHVIGTCIIEIFCIVAV